MALKYAPLQEHLKKLSANGQKIWHASFADIETIIMAKLPCSAHKHNAWWANQVSGKRPQAHSWMEAGWKTSCPNFQAKTVTFVRVR